MDTLALPFEFKSLNDAGHIEGLAAAFGNVDGGGDRVIPGAFAATLADRKGAPLPMLLHHDQRRPIGVWTSLTETADGLYAKGRFTMATRDAQEAYALAKDGALAGLSIGYVARKHAMAGAVRQLQTVDLFETSLVTIPMNDRTKVRGVKSISGVRDLECALRDAGLSGRKAKAAAWAGWQAINASTDDDAADAEMAALFTNSARRIAGL